jgi:hypothetical protein
MKIGLHNTDKTRFPNLALLKLSAWHKAQGDVVERFIALCTYDKIYSASVFSWSTPDPFLPRDTIKGGTGYDIKVDLPDAIEHTCPDYAFADIDYSMGFLTRGCTRSCPWCVVPEKEGDIRAHADIEEFCRHRDVVLMDNNVLANEHGIQQIEKMTRLGLRVDFNQGLDARLVDAQMASRLAALKWMRCVRFSCDHKSQMPAVKKAVELLRAAGLRKEIDCYVLVDDIDDALHRVEFLRSLNVVPFAQPYRKIGSKTEPARELKNFARWVNHRAIFKTVSWSDYIKGSKSIKVEKPRGLQGLFNFTVGSANQPQTQVNYA